MRSLATVDPDFQRTYNLEYTAGIQHELLPRVSVAATYYRRQFYDLPVTDNLLRTPADYRAVDVVSPLNGEVFNGLHGGNTPRSCAPVQRLRHQRRRPTASRSTTAATSPSTRGCPAAARSSAASRWSARCA